MRPSRASAPLTAVSAPRQIRTLSSLVGEGAGKKAIMTERAGWMPRVSRRQILRGGASVLAATALTGHSASAAEGAGDGSVTPVGPGLGRPFTGLRTFVVNVADLGAVGDGRADDSWAFE